MFKVAATGVCGGIVCIFLKNNKSEFYIPTAIITGVVIMYFVLSYVTGVNEKIIELTAKCGIEISYIKIVMKVICIAYICTFTCDLLNDANLTSVALKVEMAGRLIIFSYAIPIVFALTDMCEKILKNI